jgi:hypothetical protein
MSLTRDSELFNSLRFGLSQHSIYNEVRKIERFVLAGIRFIIADIKPVSNIDIISTQLI